MPTYISGKELIERWNILPFQIYDYLKKGLPVYSETGKRIRDLDPFMPQCSTDEAKLIKLSQMLEFWLERLESWERTNEEWRTELPDLPWTDSDSQVAAKYQENYFKYKSALEGYISNTRNEINELKYIGVNLIPTKKLPIDYNEFSWINFSPPILTQESPGWLNAVMEFLFRAEDIHELEEKRTGSTTTKKLPPSQRHESADESELPFSEKTTLRNVSSDPNEKPIIGWKKIAEIMGVAERTAQSYRKELKKYDIIFYRKTGKPPQKRVFAYPSILKKYTATR